MDRFYRSLTLSTLLAFTPVTQATPSVAYGEPLTTMPPLIDAQLLDPEEMKSVDGSVAPLVLGHALAVMVGAITFGVANAINQYKDTGEVLAGPVMASAGLGAALAAVNVGAVLTESVVVMVTAAGLDIALTSAIAFSKEPDPASHTVEDLKADYIENYNHQTTLFHMKDMEDGHSTLMEIDLMRLANLGRVNIGPGNTLPSGLAYPAYGGTGNAGTGFGHWDANPIELSGFGFGGGGANGAGEDHYRFF